MTFPVAQRHPGVETALTRDDVGPGIAFVTFVPGSHETEMRGVFTDGASYDEDLRWHTTGEVGGAAMQLCLYDMGITPDGLGEWAKTVTIPEDLE